MALQVAEQMADYLLTGAVVNSLNMPNVTAEEAPRLAPYLDLAEKLGSFAGQLTDTDIKAVSIEYEGDVAALNVKPLSQVALMGVLRPQLTSVNMVNAPVIARERGIEMAEVKHERASDYHSMIRLTVTAEKYTRSVTGTLFGGKHPRIVDIKGIEIEAEFAPHMLYITNDDKPGFIGRLGTLLGESKVNIATFHLGRDAPGGSAIALVQVDQPISPELHRQDRRPRGRRSGEVAEFLTERGPEDADGQTCLSPLSDAASASNRRGFGPVSGRWSHRLSRGADAKARRFSGPTAEENLDLHWLSHWQSRILVCSSRMAPRHYQHSKNPVDEQMPAVAPEAQVDCSGAAHIFRHDPCSFGVVVWTL